MLLFPSFHFFSQDTQQALKQLRDLLAALSERYCLLACVFKLLVCRIAISMETTLLFFLWLWKWARMFKSNSWVKNRANEAYSKFKGLYLNGVTQPMCFGPKKVSILPKSGKERGRLAIICQNDHSLSSPQSVGEHHPQRTY